MEQQQPQLIASENFLFSSLIEEKNYKTKKFYVYICKPILNN